MKTVCIVGAGAIGGFLGTRLAAAGLPVSALARGATLQALRSQGWRMESPHGLEQAPLCHASDSATELGVHDLVFIAVKSQSLPALAPQLAPLIGTHTVVVTAMNGVPWWFCQNTPGLGNTPLRSVDPQGAIACALPLAQVLGCVVHASTSTQEPGLVRHHMGQGLIVGEPVGGTSERASAVVALLRDAGFDATASEQVRRDIWYKLWGNMTMNPVSALTGATTDRILDDPLVSAFCVSAMQEAAAIGARIGCPIEQSAQDRQSVTRRLGAFRTSMLQDVQAGRGIELDALVGAVHEIGTRLDHPMPYIGALLGLTRLFGRSHGLVPVDS